MVLAITVSAIMVRNLGNTSYGVYSLLTSILAFASLICKFSFDAALLRYIPEYKKHNDTAGLKSFIYKIISFQLIIWLVMVLIFYMSENALSGFYKVDLVPYLFIGMLSTLITIYNLILETILTAYYRIKIQVALSIISGVLQIPLLYILLTVCHLNIIGCFVAIIFKDVLVSLVYLKVIANIFYPPASSASVKIKAARVFNFAVPNLFSNLVNQLVLSQSETIYLGYYSTIDNVGIYNLGYSFPQRFITVIPDILRNISYAAITDFYLKDKTYLKRLVEIYFKLLFLIIAPVSIGGALLVDTAIVMIYGPGMQSAGIIAQVLFIVHTFIFFSNPYTFAMATLENMWISFRISIFSAIVSIALNLILISRYGLAGAVVSTSLALLINGILRFAIYRKYYMFVEIPWKCIGKAYLTTIFFFLVIPFKHLITHPAHVLIAFLYMTICWIITAKRLKVIDADGVSFLSNLPIPYSKKIADFFSG